MGWLSGWWSGVIRWMVNWGDWVDSGVGGCVDVGVGWLSGWWG